MFILPAPSLAVVSELPIPKDLRQLPDNFILRAIAKSVADYPGLIPDLNKAPKWTAFKAFIGERCDALKITDFYIHLYENDEYPFRLLFQLSFMADAQQMLIELAEETGFGNLARQKVDEADPERLKTFMQTVVGEFLEELSESIDTADDWDQVEAEAKNYWSEVHPTLPLEEQQRGERDCQFTASLLLYFLHNTISVMAYGESLSSLVKRAIAGEPGEEQDRAKCLAVRIDNNLREHPKFKERYLLATRKDDADFLRAYNNTTPPLAGGVRYRGLYFLFSILDCYGYLDRLSNRQVLDLCDHAKLDRWGARIEDESYLRKRREEYLRHKFVQKSRHSN